MFPNIIARDIAEQHLSLFNLKAFGTNNIGQVIDKSKVSKLDSKGQTNDKCGIFLNVRTNWKGIE
jgi:hypothetical protein